MHVGQEHYLSLVTNGPVINLTIFYVPTKGHNGLLLNEVLPLSKRKKVFHLMITHFQPRVTQ